jgi:hypothetical protein
VRRQSDETEGTLGTVDVTLLVCLLCPASRYALFLIAAKSFLMVCCSRRRRIDSRKLAGPRKGNPEKDNTFNPYLIAATHDVPSLESLTKVGVFVGAGGYTLPRAITMNPGGAD